MGNTFIMNKIKFYLLIDSFFIFFSLFFTLFAILKYNRLKYALLLSGILSAILTCGFAVIIIIRNDKKTNAHTQKELIKALANHLAFLSDSEVLNLFLKYYSIFFKDAKIEENKIVIKKIKTCIFPIFTLEKITTKEVINAYKQTKKGYKTKVLFNGCTSEVYLLSTHLKIRIELFDINSIFFALKEQNLLPNLEIIKQNKIKILPILKNLLKKQKAGKFLLFGILTLLFSTITFFPLYYIIVGCALIIIAIILKFFAPFENHKNIGL